MPNSVPLPPPGFDDLSVDEKIDYVQSLWDRITVRPDTIAVPHWHRDILDERLNDDQDGPDAGDTWEVVQERLRTGLDWFGVSRRLIVRPLAEDDLANAAKWYENAQAGLAPRFLVEVDRTLSSIRERPLQFPVVWRELRRALLHTFPYAVYFRAADDVVTVLAVLHHRRNSTLLRGRAR
jgi:putative addiction module component (TIGR02574 family)